MLEELALDNISDKWENNTHFDERPIIGILTQPVAEDKRGTFDYDQYILEINENFVHWAGSKTVAIPFDI